MAHSLADTRSSQFFEHNTYKGLMRSVDEGCYICNRFWETLSVQEQVSFTSTLGKGDKISATDYAVEVIEECITYISSLEEGYDYSYPGCYLFEVGCNKSVMNCPSLSNSPFWKVHFLLEPFQDAIKFAAPQSVATSTRSPETMSLAKHWIRECTQSHERCKASVIRESWYPTRLLFFDHKASIVRLIETGQITPRGKYITLTHRWGPADHIKLTKDTYAQLLKGVVLSTLPQVFQEAISICYDLGISYIWIDSLCIFQGRDHILDWQREVSLMGNVYSNSFCNISAADTPDCSQSIFCDRDPRVVNPPVVDVTLRTGTNTSTTERFVLHENRFWEHEVSNALVNKRGWVLQERFLAPRILQFGRRQLIWECREKDAAEAYPHGLPLVLLNPKHTQFKQLDPPDYMGDVSLYKVRRTDGNSALHLLWVRIVELYTASALTVPSDKLIACSGIAKKMAEIVQDEYVAGMWRQYLEGELLWSVHRNHLAECWTRPKEYRAPTWSWASIDGPVHAGEPRIKDSLITVEDHCIEYLTSDKFAAIRGGWLRLRGVLRRITLQRKILALGGGYHWDMVLNSEKTKTQERVSPDMSEPRVMLDIVQDFEEENAKGLLFCMCARSINVDGRGMYILLLQRVEGEIGTFRRIGIAWAWSNNVKEKLLVRDVEEAQLPCILYRSGLHSIYII